jgi:hypothetical protein
MIPKVIYDDVERRIREQPPPIASLRVGRSALEHPAPINAVNDRNDKASSVKQPIITLTGTGSHSSI